MRRRVLAVIVVILAVVSSPVRAKTSGRLCIAGSECRDTACGGAVEPAAERRLFTWTSATNDAVTVGMLEPDVAAIPCAGQGRVELRVSTRLPRGTAVQIRVSGGPENVWEIPASARQLEKPLLIFAPSGTYDVTIAASRFQSRRLQVRVGETPQVASVDLVRLPVLTGIVVDHATGRPVPGALVATDQESEAVTDGTGRFAIDADPERWPKLLRASAGGYAETTLAPPPARVSANLGDIRLSRGGSVAVTLEEKTQGSVVAVELKKLRNKGRSLGETVQSLDAGRTMRFMNVEPGDYVVLAKGDDPWERVGEPVRVTAAEEAQIHLSVVPFQLRVRAIMEGSPLPSSRVIVKNRDGLWEAVLTMNAEGEASVGLWQPGRMQLTLEAPAILPYREQRDVVTAEDADWLLDVPAYEITGVVIDDTTEEPIPNAGLALYMESNAGYSFGFKSKAENDGSFRFAPVAHGRHTLSAAAAGYPPSEVSYLFDESEQTRRVTLRLKAARTVPVTVLSPRGEPLAGARVVDFDGLTRIGVGFTDLTGTVGVQVPPGEARDVYVIPRDGSLGFLRIESDAQKETVRISDGVCRIVLRMESEERAPIPNLFVAVRYNGRVVPYEVLQALVTMHGARTKSDADGRIVLDHMPGGIYEFWPVGSSGELRAVAASVGAGEAPLKIAAVPGENVAVMTFAAVD